MTRLLYILPGLIPPASDPTRDKFYYLSDICEGDVLLPVWWRSSNQAAPHLARTFPVYALGRFSYHLLLFHKFPRVFRKPACFLWYLTSGIHLHRQKKYGVIVTYGTNTPALAGTILKWVTGAKLIVEIPGVPENAFRYDVQTPGRLAWAKRFLANLLLVFVGRAADCLKLLYPSQLKKYPSLQTKKVAVFHDFVPVRCVPPAQEEKEQFVLCAGYPWYTKGADILIRAFKLVSKQYPDFKLKLMGYFPDRSVLEELAESHPQIEFLAARPHEAALKVISACSIYVLASRTESMGRVLLEAMAAGRPIIASNVGGVPYYICDNENGLLFSSENVDELAAKMAHLINDKGLRASLGQRGHDRVFAEFDEAAYVRSFKRMLDSLQIESPSFEARSRQEPVASGKG